MKATIMIIILFGISICVGNRLNEIIKEVKDNRHSPWIPSTNSLTHLKPTQLKKICGTKRRGTRVLVTNTTMVSLTSIVSKNYKPSLEFDARTKWPNCSLIIGTVRNQGICGSCWAFTTAEVIADRMCIKSNGKRKLIMSPQNLISCCISCGYGCDGGYLEEAFIYWTKTGIVSGGDYGSNVGCQPYSSEAYLYSNRTACVKQCQNGSGISYWSDLRFGFYAYAVPPIVLVIQAEIQTNGSVGAMMIVHEDFITYRQGVYTYVTGDFLGSHAIKIIGWGVENGTAYWLCVNSWGIYWGINGLFKIKRGTNESGIESSITTGN